MKSSLTTFILSSLIIFINVAPVSGFNVFQANNEIKTIRPSTQLEDAPLFISALATAGNKILLCSKSQKRLLLSNPEFTNYDKTWDLDSSPTGVISDGKTAWVTTDKGTLYSINLSNDNIKTTSVEDGATYPILHENAIYVLEQFNNTVAKIDKTTLKLIKRVGVPREPKVATLNSDGSLLFVANFLPKQRADLDHVAADISIMDTKSMKEIKRIKLANGSNALRGISLSADGKYLFVSHNLGRYTVPTSQLQQGWMNTSAMSVIDANELTYIGAIILDEPDRGAAGIWDIKSTAEKIFITHSGTHDMSVIDYPKFVEKLHNYKGNLEALSYDLRFMYSLRERVKLVGNGHRNMVVLNDKLIIPAYFSDTINVVDMQTSRIEIIPLVENRKETLEQTGEKIFNDATFCFQNWQSCNGCHPNDGRTDGLNWDLLNDGIGNSKNCKSLLYSIQTPPSMITGIRENAVIANRKGFIHIQFYNIPEEKALAIDAYTKSLKAVPSPYLVDGELSEKAKKGEKVFYELDCHVCHYGPYYTDLKTYRIGDDIEFEQGWDTPTLLEVWRTAPYLFDGRAEDMIDVFKIHKHGIERKVSKKDLESLTEYVLSL